MPRPSESWLNGSAAWSGSFSETREQTHPPPTICTRRPFALRWRGFAAVSFETPRAERLHGELGSQPGDRSLSTAGALPAQRPRGARGRPVEGTVPRSVRHSVEQARVGVRPTWYRGRAATHTL